MDVGLDVNELKSTGCEELPEPATEQWDLVSGSAPGFGEQDEFGIDLSLLRENLRLTPAERLRKHYRCAQSLLELRRAGLAARRARTAAGRGGDRGGAA
jgi:hypothetical protein